MDQTTRLPLGFDLSCDQPQMPNVYNDGFTQSTARWDCGGVVTSKKSDFFAFGSPPVLRYSIGTTFNIFWRSPGPVPTRFLLSKPKLKYMQNYQGFQNPPNPIRKKSAQLGRGQLPVRRPDQTHQLFGHRMGEDLNRKMGPKKVLKHLATSFSICGKL